VAFKDLESIGEMFEGLTGCLSDSQYYSGRFEDADPQILFVDVKALGTPAHTQYMQQYRAVNHPFVAVERAKQAERNKRPETKECKREWNRKRRADPAYRDAERAKNRERMRRAREQAI
jgi:hypothetical protein